MSTTTTNYNLIKPALTDAADITAMNPNWDSIDSLLKNSQRHYDGDIVNFDTALTRGKYFVSGQNLTGAPYSGNNYGTLFVFLADFKETWQSGNVYWLTQVFVDTKNKVFIRQRINDADFTSWEQIFTTNNKPTLNELSGTVSIAKGGTGATNNIDALDNLSAIASYRGTVNGTDYTFNTALTQGEYLVTGTDMDGAPSTGTIYGKLVVIVSTGTTHNNSSNWIWQVYYSTSFGKIYYRSKVNQGEWSSWSEIYNQNNKPTPADIGAAASSHNQAASTITAGTFAATGVVAKTGTDYTTYRVRNIMANTTAFTANSTALSNGNIHLQYE